MDDIRRNDQAALVKECFTAAHIVVLFFTLLVAVALATENLPMAGGLVGAVGTILYFRATKASLLSRWKQSRYLTQWQQCENRLQRFDEVLKQMSRGQVSDLQDMPETVRRVGRSIYLALRRADIISHEVQRTEQGIHQGPTNWSAPSHDAQANELYRLADKNIAEYRQQLSAVLAGVHRAEAQSAVFVTTVDFLRMKLIGRRLVGQEVEMSSQDFLAALSEARLQFNAIDKALEELDFTGVPQSSASGMPAIPADAYDEQRLGNGQ